MNWDAIRQTVHRIAVTEYESSIEMEQDMLELATAAYNLGHRDGERDQRSRDSVRPGHGDMGG